MGRAVVIDHEATKETLDLLDRPKSRELIRSLGESFLERLRLQFPGLVSEVVEWDTYGQGDIAYRIKVKGHQLDKVEDFLAGEELKILLEHGVTILTFVSDGVSDTENAQS